MTKGILLIGVGHVNYTSMAANLAAGIKHNCPRMQIAIATDNILPPNPILYPNLFDQHIHVPAEMYTTKGETEFIKVKTHMYDLSPFDETIFLDADMAWINNRNPEDLFEELKDIEFTIANTGEAKESVWADIGQVKKAWKTEKPFYNYHSEFVYFKKSPAVKAYFDKVKSVYLNPKVKGTSFGGARIADELAFQIASMVLDYYPHKDNFLPTFWWGRCVGTSDFYKYPYQLPESFFGYSIGGKITPPNVAKNYNSLASFYFQKAKLANPWFAKNKQSFIPNRKNI